MELESIKPAHIHDYIRWRKRSGLSDASINRDLATLKHMLNYAEECGWTETNPISRVKSLKETREERRRFTEEEVNEVIGNVRDECRPLFIFMKETGCRREEALSLKHSQVQAESNLVVFTGDTKSRRFRYVPLTETAIDAINTLPPVEGCPWVFYNPRTHQRWKECRKEWEKARKLADLPGLLVKDLRRCFAIRLAEGGTDMHDIQQVLGHSSVVTTEKYYAHFSPQSSSMKVLRVLEGGRSNRNKTETSINFRPLEQSG